MNYQRQRAIFDSKLFCFDVTLIGCGSLGSPTAHVLVKTGCSLLTLIDPDIVEEHNLPSQLFRLRDVGKPKVEALARYLREISPCKVKVCQKRFGKKGQKLSGIVISGVDSMESRKDIWKQVQWNVDVPVYIDGRLGGSVMEIFTIMPCQLEDVEYYEKDWLFDDSQAVLLPCAARANMHTGFVVAGLIVAQLVKFLKEESYLRRVNLDLVTMTQVME